MLAAITQDEVELAYEEQTPRVGIVLDLKKCYNTIPRTPIAELFRRAGIPEAYIRALTRMYKDMRRVIEAAGTAGRTHASTTGVAEGCSMSVAAMTVLTMFVVKALHHQPELQTALAICYADNWSVITRAFHTLTQAFETLAAIVEALKMAISPEKSWTWATTAKRQNQTQDSSAQRSQSTSANTRNRPRM